MKRTHNARCSTTKVPGPVLPELSLRCLQDLELQEVTQMASIPTRQALVRAAGGVQQQQGKWTTVRSLSPQSRPHSSLGAVNAALDAATCAVHWSTRSGCCLCAG